MGFWIKMIALVNLSIILIIHWYYGNIMDVDHFITNGSEFGYFIILFGLLIGHASNRLECFYSLIGSVLFFISAGMILTDWYLTRRSNAILDSSSSRGLWAIVEVILLFANAICPDNNELNRPSSAARQGDTV